MTGLRRGEGADARIEELRRAVADDLEALRRAWDDRARIAAEVPAYAVRLQRGVPGWAIGAVAGLLAGLYSSLIRRNSSRDSP
jgi:hypothetical protein